MNVSIDQRFLNRVIIVLVACMIITGLLIGLKMAGFLGAVPDYPGGSPSRNVTAGSHSSDDGAGDLVPGSDHVRQGNNRTSGKDDRKNLTLSWTYNNESFAYTQTVSNSTYYSFTPVPMANGSRDARILPYIVTTGDEGLVTGIARYILSASAAHGWGDYDTVGSLVALLSRYDGSGSFRNLPPASSYKYPFQTMFDGTGSRDDVTILGAAILESMGYPVAVIEYPRQYDRGYFIHEYEGVALRCDKSVPGNKYFVESAAPAGTVTCRPGTGLCSLQNETVPRDTNGLLRGNATIHYSDNRTQTAGITEWNIRSGVVSYRAGFTPRSDRVAATLVFENASWIARDYYCYVDTANPSVLPATIPGALAKADPRVIPLAASATGNLSIYRDNRIDATLKPLLRSPSPLNQTNRSGNPVSEQSISGDLNIPVPSGDTDEIAPVNRQSEQQYWQDVWYDRSTWYYDQVWYLDVVNYSVVEQPYLYTRQKEFYIAPASAWRIRYAAVPVNPPDEDLPGLSTFSDMRFAVYKINEETNTATLFDTFSFGYATGQEDLKYRYYYETGTFYIAVFVRNCVADVSVQMHGKQPSKTGS